MGAYNSEDTSSDEDTETVQRTTRSGRTNHVCPYQ